MIDYESKMTDCKPRCQSLIKIIKNSNLLRICVDVKTAY